MDISNASSEGSVGSNRAVVRALSSRITIVRPAERMASKLGRGGNKSVLLLDSVPGLLGKIRIPNLVSKVSEVSVGRNELLVGGVFPHVSLTEDKDVVSLSEGVLVVGNRLEVNLRVLGSGHVARRSIKVPHGDISERLNLLVESSALSAESDTGSIKPDVLSDDFTALVNAEGVLVLTLKVCVIEAAHL